MAYRVRRSCSLEVPVYFQRRHIRIRSIAADSLLKFPLLKQCGLSLQMFDSTSLSQLQVVCRSDLQRRTLHIGSVHVFAIFYGGYFHLNDLVAGITEVKCHFHDVVAVSVSIP
jgi:hypothetical protein